MTKPKPAFGCDICGLQITSEKQYIFEVYDDKGSWAKTQTRAKNIDCCQKCFMQICEMKHFDGLKYIPKWESTIKNPKYVKGGSQPYRLPVNTGITSTNPQELIA